MPPARRDLPESVKAMLMRVSMIVFLTTAVSSIVFQSTTFALPKVFEERLGGIAVSATAVGRLAFLVFALGSMGQLVVGPLSRQAGSAHRVHRRGLGAGRVLRHDARALTGLAGPALRHGVHAGGLRPDPDQRLHDRPPGEGEWRARIYGVRYVVSFTALAAALP